MGSQTLEILRQGVWASLTGGWFYDPHQGVFSNVVHLYLWLFLLCFPFITYMYFPATLLTWGIYCFSTSVTILCAKLVNMALHRLYDQAQTMSGASLKNPFFKITKDNDERDDETGIEMQVMRNDVPSQNSVEQAINEASEENSVMSVENANSILDLKVDVHRKNSSESIELMLYAPSVISSVSQQEQQLIENVSNSATKSSNRNSTTHDMNPDFLSVYPENESAIQKTSVSNDNSNTAASRPTCQLQRKAAIRHQRKRLERQNSLDVGAESALILKLGRGQLEALSTVFDGYCTETFLHSQTLQQQNLDVSRVSATSSKACSTSTVLTMAPAISRTPMNTNFLQRLPAANASPITTSASTSTPAELSAANSPKMCSSMPSTATNNKTARLQRHRSSETHDERVRKQNRGLFLPIHHEQHHISSGAGSSTALTGMHAVDELELGLGGSTGTGTGNSIDVAGRRGHGLFSLDFGSSSDVYLEDDSFTKSDLGIEQLNKRKGRDSSGPKSKSAIVLQQQQNPMSHCYQHQQKFLQHRPGTNIRKDSNSTMSALQLPVTAALPNSKQAHSIKRRRHSNATSFYKNVGVSSCRSAGVAPPQISRQQQPTVRRIKSAALEISCPHPSVSNLMPHPNSVEAISGQQQIKNPKSALLPPPSKCLVRNAHLNLCSAYGSGFGSSALGLNVGTTSGVGSSGALIDPVYPIVEQADEKVSLDIELGVQQDLIIHDIDSDCVEDEEEEMLQVTQNRGLGTNEVETDDYRTGHNIEIEENNRRRCQDHAAYEADVRQILDDDDDFKASDENLDVILNEVHINSAPPNSDCMRKDKRNPARSDSESSDGERGQRCDGAAPESQVSSERLQSSDSETDKNGSRSPLLSGNKGRDRSVSSTGIDKFMGEVPSAQPQKSPALCNLLPQHLYKTRPTKGEGDSGCPSSDCEQVSSSSKDMLLSDMNAPEHKRTCRSSSNDDNIGKNSNEQDLPSVTTSISCTTGKNLGAIPKVVKYREIDEERRNNDSVNADNVSSQQQLNKRRSGQNTQTLAAFGSSAPKTISRTSSSASSKSFSADSFSADIHKMLWLMSGGAVDGTGRPITSGANVAEDSQSFTASVNAVPTSMSVAHFQFYQDALNALHSHPSSTVDRLSASDRMYLREKIRSSSKQMSDTGNLSLEEFTHLEDLPAALVNTGTAEARSAMNSQVVGAVMPSSTFVSGTRHSNNNAPLTIQGLINVINDGRYSSSASTRVVTSRPDNSTTAAILNIDGHQIDNYCDYWRPACMLSTEKPIVPKTFYKYRFKFFGFEREVKIAMDRLELLALFDRDLHWIHIILSVTLACTVSYLGSAILQLGFYKDLFAFLFCAVIAGSQYSLLKSVQPDATSPIHGFNKTVAYSRAIYFSCCGGLLLLLQDLKLRYEQLPSTQLVLFGVSYAPLELVKLLLHAMYVLLLSFPLIFSLGLFPQINTFLMYFFEQIDMHVFGGNASSSLLGSFLCVIRSSLGVLILYGPLYAALAEEKGTQYIVFSLFCAILVPLGYHLSRSASDFSNLWALVKNSIVSTYREDDDELSAATSSAECPSVQKLTSSTPKHSETDPAITNDQTVNKSEKIEMCSLEKLPPTEEVEEHTLCDGKDIKSKPTSLTSSNTTLPKTYSSNKKPATANSNSFTSADEKERSPAGESTNMFSGDSLEETLKKQRCNNTSQGEPQENDEVDKVSASSTTNAGDISTLTACGAANGNVTENEAESPDPLPKKLQNTVNTRLKNDLVVTSLLAILVFCLHCSTVFSVLQPDLNVVLYAISGALGLLIHYIIPQMRKHTPWQCFSRPILRQKEFGQFEVSNAAKVMWFEKIYIYLSMLERNVLFPLLAISALTADAQKISNKFGIAWGSLIIATCALKFIRNAYSDPTNQYLIVMFTVLFFRIDFAMASETFLIDYFFVSIAFRKCCDFLLKMQFIVTYIAPWQITWGSAFHAFAQPFSVPHSAMLFLQAGISALLSTPLNPFLGSAIFLTSYVRPIKFWERDYNTRRIDHSNTRLSSQLERDLGADDNNLNSIFYEHLTRSLQHSLCGDLLMGRWGNVNQGDCFVLASDYLNCLVHIIELGNGLCTFQMRGLEFRGTYCQQREVEAITEDAGDNDGCCCCDPGHLPRMLSANAMFSTRWLAWQVVAAQYVLEGYSISDNLASATLQVFEYRKVLITYYIKSIIYYVIKNPKLEMWLTSGPIQDALQHTLSRQFVDLDPIFNYNLDEDFDFRALGITRTSFCFVYLSWMRYCWDKRRERQSVTSYMQTSPAVAENSLRNTQTNFSLTYGHSQSHTLLRARPQKSATMSGTGTTSTSSAAHSNEHTITTSQSFANISRQTSGSTPGLPGIEMPRIENDLHDGQTRPQSNGNMGSVASGTPCGPSTTKTPQKPPKTYDRFQKHCSPARDTAAFTNNNNSAAIVKNSPLVSLCLALGLLARRSLATASHSSLTGVEFFLHGLHALFKGDFRITSPRDEWVFADMELLHGIVAPAVKMALKLQQDHISNPDEFLDPEALYSAISTYSTELVISHEADPVWRSAVLRGASNLLALRHVLEDGSDEYRIIRLTKRYLSFRVIKLNRECVRGLWAGQQQELIYLRNRNPERGSIQNAKQALRNIINSSCDQPIGYPIYVSPLTTSYADTNEQLCQVIGGAITPETIRNNITAWWQRVRERCRQGCSSGSTLDQPANVGSAVIGTGFNINISPETGDLAPVYISAPLYNTLTVGNFFGMRTGNPGGISGISGSLSSQYGSQGLASAATTRSGLAAMNKPTSTTLLAGLLNREREQEREVVRDPRFHRKSQTYTNGRNDRERRATLPITSSCLGVLNSAGDPSVEGTPDLVEYDKIDPSTNARLKSSPRYTKISSSSGNLGIGNIITTPGDYPRKSKGPICLSATTPEADENVEKVGRALIDLFKKVVIVDGTEIYDCLDMGRRIDVVWPNDKMRSNGGRLSWKDWTPRVGMLGKVVHYWIPNHPDKRFRSHVNRTLYLIEIGDHYVPVGEFGIREYYQIVEWRESTERNSCRSLVQREYDEHLDRERGRDALTPILGSSLESPTIMATSNCYQEPYTETEVKSETISGPCEAVKEKRGVTRISAVSSSSSSGDDDELSNLERRMEMHRRDIMNMMKLMSEKQKDVPKRNDVKENGDKTISIGNQSVDCVAENEVDVVKSATIETNKKAEIREESESSSTICHQENIALCEEVQLEAEAERQKQENGKQSAVSFNESKEI